MTWACVLAHTKLTMLFLLDSDDDGWECRSAVASSDVSVKRGDSCGFRQSTIHWSFKWFMDVT
jgi:hypothetical protein